MKKKILLIEPYYGGSHKVLIDLIKGIFENSPGGDEQSRYDNHSTHLVVMSGKKWHWRARTSALFFAQSIPKAEEFVYETVFASCVLPLHELVALRQDLKNAKKIIYFHENQLVYPKRKTKERDFQYGYNQIMSSLVADVVIFNSEFNKESFLSNLKKFFKLQPDYRPTNLREMIEPKCKVLYFPIEFDKLIEFSLVDRVTGGRTLPEDIIHIVWPHRWEFDKNPDMFFNVIFRLVNAGYRNFRLSVLGENFTDNPPIFKEAEDKLRSYLLHFGFLPSKREYYSVLADSDIVISTADHEFFGVAMIEAAFCGCYPLCPKSLVYPEIFSGYTDAFYISEDDLFNKLKDILQTPLSFREKLKSLLKADFGRFDWQTLKPQYVQELINSDDSILS